LEDEEAARKKKDAEAAAAAALAEKKRLEEEDLARKKKEADAAAALAAAAEKKRLEAEEADRKKKEAEAAAKAAKEAEKEKKKAEERAKEVEKAARKAEEKAKEAEEKAAKAAKKQELKDSKSADVKSPRKDSETAVDGKQPVSPRSGVEASVSTHGESSSTAGTVTTPATTPGKSASGRTRITRSESTVAELPITQTLSHYGTMRPVRSRRAPSRAFSTRELEDRRNQMIAKGEIVDRAVVRSPLTDEQIAAASGSSESASSSSSSAAEESPSRPKGIPKGAVKMGMGMPAFDPAAALGKLKSTKK
jgi:hypothetical protein